MARSYEHLLPCFTDPPRSEPTSDSLEGRKAMFSYILTLLRGQYQEHGGAMPAIDVAGMEHLAWCMDSLFYLLQVSASKTALSLIPRFSPQKREEERGKSLRARLYCTVNSEVLQRNDENKVVVVGTTCRYSGLSCRCSEQGMGNHRPSQSSTMHVLHRWYRVP